MNTKLIKLTDNIYYSEADHSIDQQIIAAIVGANKTLMIDAGVSREYALSFRDAVKHITGRDIDYVVLTHWHWDHVFGFSSLEMGSFGQMNIAAHLNRMKGYTWEDEALYERVRSGEEIEFCAGNIQKVYGENRDISIKLPEIYFDNRLDIDLGGITCELHHIPTDHTDDMTAVFVKERKVLFLSDALGPQFYADKPYYKSKTVKKLMEVIKSFDAEWFVVSHDCPRRLEEFLENTEILEATATLILDGVNDKHRLIDRLRQMMGDRLLNDDEEVVQLFLNGDQASV